MSTIIASTGTYTLTNETITLNDNWGIRGISILCTSTTSGTITGTLNLGARASDSLVLNQNETATYIAIGTGVLSGLVITAPAGCTLEVIAQS